MSNRSAYDELPYPSKFFLQTHPDRLATAAILYGMDPPPVSTCRVLDIGCGNGSNLISQAFGLTNAQFVGIDLSQTHIDRASESAAELALDNITFRRMNVMDMTAGEFGRFDYITAHGLFAWVPDVVRKRVLELFSELLTSNGVGYISYNAYPGAYAREMVRSMMRFHTDRIEEPAEKVDTAIKLLGLLAKNTTERDIHGRILDHELKRHFEHYPADIYHDDLGDTYRPFYFHEFASLLSENGLQFLSEAELHASTTQGLGEDAVNFLDSVDDRVSREQYLDFFRGRVFRQTLFCRSETELLERPQPDVLNKLYLSSSIRPVDHIGNIASSKIEKFRSAKGQQLQIDNSLTKAALVYLGNIWGRSISMPALTQTAHAMLRSAGASEASDEDDSALKTILLQIALGSDIIELHSYEPAAAAGPGPKPKVNRLARWQLRDANNVLTLLNKDLKLNDTVSRRLLELMDGTRTVEQLAAQLRPFIQAAEDLNEKDKSALKQSLDSWIKNSIEELARLGVFES